MTPKEKAIELFDKFLGQCASDNGEQALILTKACAIICVDEVIQETKIYEYGHPILIEKQLKYWEQVKTEIENL